MSSPGYSQGHLDLDERDLPLQSLLNIKRQIEKHQAKCLFEGDRVAMAQRAFRDEPGFDKYGLDPWQPDFLLCEDENVIVNCARQIGKSSTAATAALHTAMFEPGSDILIFGPAQRQSFEFFHKLMPIYRDVGELVEATSEQKLTLELINGSRIIALPGKGRTTRGFSKPRLVIIDEAAHVEDDDLYYDTVVPMFLRSHAGQLMLLSTPWGRRGFFYDIWMNGEDWRRFRVPITDVPSIWRDPKRRAWVQKRRNELPDYKFRQEFMCEFVDTEDQIFTTEMIERAYRPHIKPLF